MLLTRRVNHWLGTSYTIQEVAEWPPLAWEIFDALVASTKEEG